jgi:hypothetical protein
LHWRLLIAKRLNSLVNNSRLLLPGHQTLKPCYFFFAVFVNLHRKTDRNSVVMVHSSKLL